MANVKIKSEDELCISTLNLVREQEKRHSGVDHKYSHKSLVARILDDVKSREKAECEVTFEFVDSREILLGQSYYYDPVAALALSGKMREVRQ